MSPSWPLPSQMPVQDFLYIRVVPMRQGTHLPQDSRAVKSRKNRAMFTMQVLSSMTTMPPEPIMAPVAERAL